MHFLGLGISKFSWEGLGRSLKRYFGNLGLQQAKLGEMQKRVDEKTVRQD